MSLQQSQPLYQQVYEIIKKLILTGEISPGEKINVSKLATHYKISRTPLREALRQLQKEGLLIQDHTSTTVVSLKKKDFEELCTCRLILEKEAIRYIIQEITPEKIQEAQEMVNEARNLLEKGDKDQAQQILELNSRFHEVLISSMSNVYLKQLLGHVRSLLILYRSNILKHDEGIHEIIKEHASILKTIVDKDEEKAVQEIESHLINDKIRGIQVLEAKF